MHGGCRYHRGQGGITERSLLLSERSLDVQIMQGMDYNRNVEAKQHLFLEVRHTCSTVLTTIGVTRQMVLMMRMSCPQPMTIMTMIMTMTLVMIVLITVSISNNNDSSHDDKKMLIATHCMTVSSAQSPQNPHCSSCFCAKLGCLAMDSIETPSPAWQQPDRHAIIVYCSSPTKQARKICCYHAH